MMSEQASTVRAREREGVSYRRGCGWGMADPSARFQWWRSSWSQDPSVRCSGGAERKAGGAKSIKRLSGQGE